MFCVEDCRVCTFYILFPPQIEHDPSYSKMSTSVMQEVDLAAKYVPYLPVSTTS